MEKIVMGKSVPETIVSVQNISCGYRSGFRMEGVSFDLQKGTFAAILGPNGTGKSTLFKALSGDLPLSGGEVLFEGKSLVAYTQKELSQRLAVVSQFTEEAAVTAREYVAMGRLPYRRPFAFFDTEEDREIVRRYMELAGVWDLRDRMMPELSGGEQQLVSIASALAQEPDLILLDEPTSHLDLTHTIRFLDLLRTLNRRTGLTVLLILHDLNLAGEYCDYLLLTTRGRLAYHGRPEEVLTRERLREVYGTELYAGTNPLTGKPLVLPVPSEFEVRSSKFGEEGKQGSCVPITGNLK